MRIINTRFIKIVAAGITIAAILALVLILTGCDATTAGVSTLATGASDIQKQKAVAADLEQRQPTPTDIDYSLERWNLIRRAYWVNGQREKAISLPCEIASRPLGYVVLITDNGAILGRFVVDGKLSSLNSYLTPDSEYYEYSNGDYSAKNKWLADVDGTYGANDDGIFWFTPDGKYMEWTGTYLYSDIPFEIDDPVLKTEGVAK